MNIRKRTIIMAAGAAVAAIAMAGTAAAQTVQPSFFPAKATTTVRTQAIGNGGVWATVSVQRTATVSGGTPVSTSLCGSGASRCFAYSATVNDTGAFTAHRLAFTPNQFIPGRHIRSGVTGRVDGTYSFSFYASTAPNQFIVPRFFAGPFTAVISWPKLFFPIGTRFSPLQISSYQVTYSAFTRCGPQRWTDSSTNGHGNQFADGNITGC
jgi:hypothetical protein